MSSVRLFVNTAGVGTVTVSRPESLNALNTETLGRLREVMQEIADNKDIRGVILTGEGEKAFVAGADIKELAALNQQQAHELALRGQSLFRSIEQLPKPVIAAVNGFALGGGCELAMACHFRIATRNARFGQPEINLGIVPGYGGTQRLTQIVGRGKALELLLTADMITAEEALALGLVNHVFETKQEMIAFAEKAIEKISSRSPIAIAGIIEAVNAGFESEKHGYETEAGLFGHCASTEDFKEGTSAFIEKRKPSFKGK